MQIVIHNMSTGRYVANYTANSIPKIGETIRTKGDKRKYLVVKVTPYLPKRSPFMHESIYSAAAYVEEV